MGVIKNRRGKLDQECQGWGLPRERWAPGSAVRKAVIQLWLLLQTITETGHKTCFAAGATVSKELLWGCSCSSATPGMLWLPLCRGPSASPGQRHCLWHQVCCSAAAIAEISPAVSQTKATGTDLGSSYLSNGEMHAQRHSILHPLPPKHLPLV